MSSEAKAKPFDCVKWTRETRDRINAEIRDMSHEEIRRYFNRRPTNPILAELFDRRQDPAILRASAQAAKNRAASGSVKRRLDEPSSDPSDKLDRNEEKVKRNEIIFEVTEAPEGGFDARAIGHALFTRGEDWDDLKEMVRDAVRCHFVGDDTPGVIRLQYVRDEAIAV